MYLGGPYSTHYKVFFISILVWSLIKAINTELTQSKEWVNTLCLQITCHDNICCRRLETTYAYLSHRITSLLIKERSTPGPTISITQELVEMQNLWATQDAPPGSAFVVGTVWSHGTVKLEKRRSNCVSSFVVDICGRIIIFWGLSFAL